MSDASDDARALDALENSRALARLVDDIVLLNRLETHDWAPDASSFNLQELLDRLTLELLPLSRRKGLTLLVRNHLNSDEMRFGDSRAIYKVLSTLLHYSLTTTSWGKISVEVDSPADRPDRLNIQIVDTGAGLTRDELGNNDFPFLGETSGDRFGRLRGSPFPLPPAVQTDGRAAEIVARPEIGTRYSILLHVPPEHQQQQEEKLLEDVTMLIDIAVDDIRKIVTHQLENWGAKCITPDERVAA